jgi:hypothetical protein
MQGCVAQCSETLENEHGVEIAPADLVPERRFRCLNTNILEKLD